MDEFVPRSEYMERIGRSDGRMTTFIVVCVIIAIGTAIGILIDILGI